MAATNLTAPAVFPFVANVTLGLGGAVSLVNLPSGLDFDVVLLARTTAAKVLDGSLSLADGDSIGSNPYMSLVAGVPFTMTFARSGGSSKLYLASTTPSQVVEVMIVRRQLGS